MNTLDLLKRPKWVVLKGGYWLDAKDMGLNDIWVVQWETFTDKLNSAGIKLNSEIDTLVWTENKTNGIITTKLAFEYIIRNGTNSEQRCWYNWLWKWNIAQKLKCFWWLTLKDKILT